jgi:hypothetical protein
LANGHIHPSPDSLNMAVGQNYSLVLRIPGAMPLAMLTKAVGHKTEKRNFNTHTTGCDFLVFLIKVAFKLRHYFLNDNQLVTE